MKNLEERIRELTRRVIKEIAREFKKPEQYFEVREIDHPSRDLPVIWGVYVGFKDKITRVLVEASNGSPDEDILAQLRDGIVSRLKDVIEG